MPGFKGWHHNGRPKEPACGKQQGQDFRREDSHTKFDLHQPLLLSRNSRIEPFAHPGLLRAFAIKNKPQRDYSR